MAGEERFYAVVIPFRDRGTDPLRTANLMCVIEHWEESHRDPPYVVTDGRSGAAQFNRSAAYNRAVRDIDLDLFVFTESDMLIDWQQISDAVVEAMTAPGLVVPFTQYHYLGEEASARVRAGADPATVPAERVHDGGTSIGAINVVSRATLEKVGRWDECFEGSWFDDNAMRRAFDVCAAPTRWITGPAYHLYHLPGWSGEHLTSEDKAATERNRARWVKYQQAHTPEDIRALTEENP